MPQIALALPANEEAPARARAAVRELDGLGREEMWRAELIVTELVTNAVLHGPGGPVELGLEVGGRAMRGQVADPGPGIKRTTERRDRGDGGRGLDLVEKLSDAWGMVAGRSRVWFEVAARA